MDDHLDPSDPRQFVGEVHRAMSNTRSSVPAKGRLLHRLAAVGGSALILSSLVMSMVASSALAAGAAGAADRRPRQRHQQPGADGRRLQGRQLQLRRRHVRLDRGPGPVDPANLPDLKAGINGFVDAFEAVPDTNGKYAGVKFNNSSASVFTLTDGYIAAAPFKTAVGTLSNPNGLTPTKAGIDAGAANDDNPVAGAPKVMFVLTDGSPNKPNTPAMT